MPGPGQEVDSAAKRINCECLHSSDRYFKKWFDAKRLLQSVSTEGIENVHTKATVEGESEPLCK